MTTDTLSEDEVTWVTDALRILGEVTDSIIALDYPARSQVLRAVVEAVDAVHRLRCALYELRWQSSPAP